jgi:hypothetical protein
MSIRDRVNEVLGDWCGTDPDGIDSTMTLEDLWESTKDSTSSPHSALPFADGLQDLLDKLGKEFKRPGPVRKDTSGFTPGSFKPSGDIDTVDCLVKAVGGCPNLPPTPGEGTE